jgi:hypothetical protein
MNLLNHHKMIKFTCRGIPLLLMIAICYLLSFRLYLITSYTFLFWTGLVFVKAVKFF